MGVVGWGCRGSGWRLGLGLGGFLVGSWWWRRWGRGEGGGGGGWVVGSIWGVDGREGREERGGL